MTERTQDKISKNTFGSPVMDHEPVACAPSVTYCPLARSTESKSAEGTD